MKTLKLRNIKSSIVNRQWSIERGLTLIELIIVVLIIATLFVALARTLNPVAQIEKANNAKRLEDFNQIKNALDAYFNDKGCYPTSIPFGSAWTVGSTVFMEKVPEDPDCTATNGSSCYTYETDNSTCPQWNILFGQLHKPYATSMANCVLSNASCLPSGGLSSYNYCSVSGKIDCNYITQSIIPSPTIPAGSGGGTTPTPTSTPVPLPTQFCGSSNVSACSNQACNFEDWHNCLGCGGTMNCYSGATCGGVNCAIQ